MIVEQGEGEVIMLLYAGILVRIFFSDCFNGQDLVRHFSLFPKVRVNCCNYPSLSLMLLLVVALFPL